MKKFLNMGVSSIKLNGGRGKVDGPEEGVGCFIVSRSNGSKLLEFCEKVLNQGARVIHVFVVFAGCLAMGLRRYDRFNPSFFQHRQHAFFRIIGFVSEQRPNGTQQRRQQRIGSLQIVRLSRCQMKATWIAQRVADGVNFRA